MDDSVLHILPGTVQDADVTCSLCALPLFKHSRCWRHYVLRFAKRRNLGDTGWWKAHEHQFLSMMRGRYSAARDGLPLGDVQEFIYMFTHGKVPLHSASNRQKLCIIDMVDAITMQAKREYYANKAISNSSKKNRR